jgi:SAM-dependent methyltransferase
MLNVLAKPKQLEWDHANGFGYYPVDLTAHPYDDSYFEKYAGYAQTEMGKALTKFRADLVDGLKPKNILDVGIGCGAFVEEMGRRHYVAYGTDINPKAVAWLTERKLLRSIDLKIDCATFFDSFEHLQYPMRAIRGVARFVAMSIPIFHDEAHALGSKHFRPDEHFYYWTQAGLIRFMHFSGFELQQESNAETLLGREGISTFVFARR